MEGNDTATSHTKHVNINLKKYVNEYVEDGIKKLSL